MFYGLGTFVSMDSQVGDVKDFQSKEEIDKFFG